MTSRFFKISICFFSLISFHLFSAVLLEDVMSEEEQKNTGVATLEATQKEALEDWLNKNFVLKTQEQKEEDKTFYLSENIENGKKLRLNDGSIYEISPSDIEMTSFWITPFPIKISLSGDPQYPLLLLNINTGSKVRARKTS